MKKIEDLLKMKKAISLLFLEIVNDVRQNILNILSKMAQTRPVVYLYV